MKPQKWFVSFSAPFKTNQKEAVSLPDSNGPAFGSRFAGQAGGLRVVRRVGAQRRPTEHLLPGKPREPVTEAEGSKRGAPVE